VDLIDPVAFANAEEKTPLPAPDVDRVRHETLLFYDAVGCRQIYQDILSQAGLPRHLRSLFANRGDPLCCWPEARPFHPLIDPIPSPQAFTPTLGLSIARLRPPTTKHRALYSALNKDDKRVAVLTAAHVAALLQRTPTGHDRHRTPASHREEIVALGKWVTECYKRHDGYHRRPRRSVTVWNKVITRLGDFVEARILRSHGEASGNQARGGEGDEDHRT